MKSAPTHIPDRGAWIFYGIAIALALIMVGMLALREWATAAFALLASLGAATHPVFRRVWFVIGYDYGYAEGVDDALRVNGEERA